jgi:hypothetical protein
MPCPVTRIAYPDSFYTMSAAAQWVAVVSTISCVFLLLSWIVLPVEKTSRHYLSISLTVGVMFMNLGFVIPLAAQPSECYDAITPNSMHTSSVCAASGSFLILGGWCGVMWIFLRALSLHLQICWQVVVGRNFMWFSQVAGWGIPAIGIIVALVISGVSFRFGPTCHINHQASLATLWIPLLVFAGFTIILQFGTFAYCIKVYLASLADGGASTEGSGLPSYAQSIKTMTPRQAYRRVKRVIQLQWRGIAIVLIIVTDVVFFSVVFVFQDNTIQQVTNNPSMADAWITCLALAGGDKTKCLKEARVLVAAQATVGAVLVLLAMNGLWLSILLGRWSMVTGWVELLMHVPNRNKREFVSVDARIDDLKKDTRSYEMLSRDSGKNMDDMVTSPVVTPLSPVAQKSALRSPRSPSAAGNTDYADYYNNLVHQDNRIAGNVDGRRTPDYFGQTARYHTPARSFSSPKPPQTVTWDMAQPGGEGSAEDNDNKYVNPLGMNRF